MRDRLSTIVGLAVGVRQFLNVDYTKLGAHDPAEIGRLVVGVVAILIGWALWNPKLSGKVSRG